MEEFPSNSNHRPRAAKAEREQDEKKIERVTQGNVVRRKTPMSKRFARTFLGGDTQSVGDFIVGDVLVPRARDMLMEAVFGALEQVLFPNGGGRAPRRSRFGSSGPSTYTPYHAVSRGGGRPRDDRREGPRRGRGSHDLGEIILETRVEAEEVLDRLDEIADRYEVATVANLYELIGVSSNYTDDKWGWPDLRAASVHRVRGGYLLNLPKPESID